MIDWGDDPPPKGYVGQSFEEAEALALAWTTRQAAAAHERTVLRLVDTGMPRAVAIERVYFAWDQKSAAIQAQARALALAMQAAGDGRPQ